MKKALQHQLLKDGGLLLATLVTFPPRYMYSNIFFKLEHKLKAYYVTFTIKRGSLGADDCYKEIGRCSAFKHLLLRTPGSCVNERVKSNLARLRLNRKCHL